MTVLSIREIYEVAREAGFDEHAAVTWTSIALAESRGQTGALNDRGEHSVGLWQINVASNVRANRWGDLHDPANNARAAYDISHRGTDMRPWTTTHDANRGTAADYRSYLGRVEQEIGIEGDHRGVTGYRAPPPTPTSYGDSPAHLDGDGRAGPTLVATLDPRGAGNWQSAVKSGSHWYVAEAMKNDHSQVFHRLDANGEEIDQMRFVGAAHATSFAVIGDTVYATHDGQVVKFAYQPGATIRAADTTPTGFQGSISLDPSQRYAVLRNGNRYRAIDIETGAPVGREVVTPRGPRQGFSIVGDTLHVLTGHTNSAARVDSYSFSTGGHLGAYDVTSSGASGAGRHREPEGMFGDLFGVKTGRGEQRRLKIFRLDPAQPAGQPTAGSDLDRVSFGGKIVDRRSAQMLAESERIANQLDPTIGKYRLTQGSWSHGAQSADTHSGPGAFDQYTQGYTEHQKQIIGLAHRTVGFASWRRSRISGKWEEHWHGIAIGTQDLPKQAQSQVRAYLDHRTGLIGNAEDDQPRPEHQLTWEQYRASHPELFSATTGAATTDPYGTPRGQLAAGSQVDVLTQDFEKLLEIAQSSTLASDHTDEDGDGLSRGVEKLLGTDPTKSDTDSDGLTDGQEISLGTNPLVADTNHDGMSDGLQVRAGVDPLRATEQSPGTGEDSSALDRFVSAAMAQQSDRYVYGAQTSMSASNPTRFDCSLLTQWSAAQAGVKLSRIAEDQYRDLKADGHSISVQQALRTKGALLFYFSTDPTGPLPKGEAHVAISLGDGRTIEARDPAHGVGVFSARGRSFNYAAVIPGISDGDVTAVPSEPGTAATGPSLPKDETDADGDGLTAWFEAMLHTDDHDPDTDLDGLSDGDEVAVYHTDPTKADTDGDRLTDSAEVSLGTKPGVADTDGDGESDGAEVAAGHDPLTPDHGGLAAGLQAGLGDQVALHHPIGPGSDHLSATHAGIDSADHV